MKKVLTSFGFGSQQNLLRLTIPSFIKYSQLHGYDSFFPNEKFFSDRTKKRKYSWWKLELIERLFESFDRVLWIDCDVVICNFTKDIMDDMHDDSHVGMVVHDVPEGYVPNCGVWLLDKKCTSWFSDLWQYDNLPRSNDWWEQDAMLHKLGIDSSQKYITLPKSFPIPWTQLDYLWNPHVHDKRGLPKQMRFFHSTMFQDRFSIMKNILSQINIYDQ